MKLKRILVFLAEIIGAFAICVLVGIGILMARLDQGPVQLDKMLPEIESALADISPGLKFRIGQARMESYQERRAIRVILKDIIVENKDGNTIGQLQEMMLGFNWRNLSSFTYMPIIVDVLHPSIEITRFTNGYVGFNLQEVPQKEKQPLTANELSDVLSRMPHDLRRVRVVGATVSYNDQLENTSFKIHDGLFDFSRFNDNVSGTMTVSIDAENFKQRVQGTISYDPQEKVTKVIAALKDFKLEQARGLFTSIPAELSLTTPLDLLMTASVDNKAQIASIDLQMTGDKGELQYAPYFPQPIAVDNMLANIRYFPAQRKVTLKTLALKLDKASLLAKGNLLRQPNKADNKKTDTMIDLQGMVENVPVDKLKEYWPHEAAVDARKWVVNQLSEGIAEQAVIDLAATISPEKEVTLDKMQGGITYKDITVNYLPPMQVVKGVTGHISYNKDIFDIHSISGSLFDTKLSKGFIRIDDLTGGDQHIYIDLKMFGPIRDAIETISSKPLEYSQKLGLVAGNFTGTGDTHLILKFPLINALTLSQVDMQTAATLHDMTAKNIVKDLGVSAKELDLKIDTRQLTLEGDGHVADSAAHVVWNEYFSDDAKFTTTLQAKGNISPALLKGLRIPVNNYFTGTAASEASITRTKENVTTVKVKSNLTNSTITIPEFKIEKKSGVSGTLDLNLVADNKGMTISNTSMSWPNFKIANASAKFTDANGLQSATLKQMQLGRSKADVIVTPLPSNGIRVNVTGNVIDLSDYWSQPKDPNAQPSNKRMELVLRAGQLYLNPDVPLSNMRMNVVMQGKELVRGTASGQTDQGGSFALQQTINRDNSRRLAIKVLNAGRVFHALDISKGVRNGTLTITGASDSKTPAVIVGDMKLEKFSMVNAPIMARLLNALSPGGLLSLLKTNGLNFSKMESKISLPNADTIKFNKGKLAGDSLGLSFSGTVNRKTDQLNIKGTIIPIEGLNKIASKIPVLGQILTGMNGNGIIGATYKIQGPSSDPSVSVNPLSALAPGILRSIFFEGSED